MASSITFKYNRTSVLGDWVQFNYTPTGGVSRTIRLTISNSVAYGNVLIGTTRMLQAINTVNTLGAYYGHLFFVNSYDDVVKITAITGTVDTFTSSINGSSISIAITSTLDLKPLVTPIAVRSPYIFKISGGSFQAVTFNVRVWEGNLGDVENYSYNYTVTKSKLTTNQASVWINPSPIAKELLKTDITTFMDWFGVYDNPISLGSGDSCWMEIEAIKKNIDSSGRETVLSATKNYFYCLDGYLKDTGLFFSNEKELPTILDEQVITNSDEGYPYFYINHHTTNLSYTVNGGSTTTISITKSDSNRDYVKCVRIPTYFFGITSPTVTLTRNTSGGNTYVKTLKIESPKCNYGRKYILFKNSSGILQTLFCNLKSTKTNQVQSTTGLRSIVEASGDIIGDRNYLHTAFKTGVVATEDWIVNTDYLPADYNNVMEELLYSEEVWIFDVESNKLHPVIVTDTSFTKIEDKLRQYSIKLKLSHSPINNIQ